MHSNICTLYFISYIYLNVILLDSSGATKFVQILGLISACILICRTHEVKYDRLENAQRNGLRVWGVGPAGAVLTNLLAGPTPAVEQASLIWRKLLFVFCLSWGTYFVFFLFYCSPDKTYADICFQCVACGIIVARGCILYLLCQTLFSTCGEEDSRCGMLVISIEALFLDCFTGMRLRLLCIIRDDRWLEKGLVCWINIFGKITSSLDGSHSVS